MSEHKESKRIIKLITKNEAVTYSAKVEVDTYEVFCKVITEVAEACPSVHVILAGCPDKAKELWVGVSIGTAQQEKLKNEWLPYSLTCISQGDLASENRIEARADLLQMTALHFTSESEAFPFKLVDQVLAVGSGFLRSHGLVEEEEDEHEYNFDDIE
jgi:hypothetical protein